jgi:hypothetical protein
MMMTNPNDDMLDDLFAQARGQDVQPSDALMARILADADDVQAAMRPKQAAAPSGLWTQMLDALGGWPAVSGLAAATVAGVWIGVAPPSSVQDLTATLVGDEVIVDLFATGFAFDTGASVDG